MIGAEWWPVVWMGYSSVEVVAGPAEPARRVAPDFDLGLREVAASGWGMGELARTAVRAAEKAESGGWKRVAM